MGLMLSVLVMCVGVLEAMSAVRHIRESYLPLEFKRKKRRMVMDMGTGSVRHVDISWPGDVPRGSHVIRRRSGMMSPHSSFDLPDDDVPRRPSVHFDPVQLERAMSEILLEEEPADEISEETPSAISQTSQEFSTCYTVESAAPPVNELRLNTETLPGNRPSLASRREADIVDPNTAVRTNSPQCDIPKSDSVTFSEETSNKFITSTTEPSPENLLIIRSGTSSTSSITAELSESPINDRSSTSAEPTLEPTTSRDPIDLPSNPEHQEHCPSISPVVSKTDGSLTSVTVINGLPTNSLCEESADKSEESISKEEPDRVQVGRLESIEELIKSTNNIIIDDGSGRQKVSNENEGQPKIADEIDPDDSVGNENIDSSLAEYIQESIQSDEVIKSVETTCNEGERVPHEDERVIEPGVTESSRLTYDDHSTSRTETESVQEEVNESPVGVGSNLTSTTCTADASEGIASMPDDSDGSVHSEGFAIRTEPQIRARQQLSYDEPEDFPETGPADATHETSRLQCDKSTSLLPTDEPNLKRFRGHQAMFTDPVDETEVPCPRGDPVLEGGFSRGSTMSLESTEESSMTSIESQGPPSLPVAKEEPDGNQKPDEDLDVESQSRIALIDLEGSPSKTEEKDFVEVIKGPLAVSDPSYVNPTRAPQQPVVPESQPENRDFSNKQTDHTSAEVLSADESKSLDPADLSVDSVERSLASAAEGDQILVTEKAPPSEAKLHEFSNSEPQGARGEAEKRLFSSDESEQAAVDLDVDALDDELKDGSVPMTKDEYVANKDETINEHTLETTNKVSLHDSETGACGQSEHGSKNNKQFSEPVDVLEIGVEAETSDPENMLGVGQHDTTKRKSLIETGNFVISTHQIGNDEHISAQRATQSNETQSATMVDCEGKSALEDRVVPSVSSAVTPSAEDEESDPDESDVGDVSGSTEIDTDAEGEIRQSSNVETPTSAHSQIKDVKSQQSDQDSNATDGDIVSSVEPQKDGTHESPEKLTTTETRGDGQNESNSNEKPTAPVQSNASEVKQDVKSVSAIEESQGEVVQLAPTTPAEPKMEDIQAPTADTSPNKAFWVRD